MSLESAMDSRSGLIKKKVTNSFPLECIDSGKHLFAIIDACDNDDVYDRVQREELGRITSLYRGKAMIDFASFSPYLFFCDPETIHWIEEKLFGSQWGYYAVVSSSHDLPSMKRHLKRFLMVKCPDGRQMYFRFYDPRVITPFLNGSDENQREKFFGPIECFIVEENGVLDSISISKTARDFTFEPSAQPFCLSDQNLKSFAEDKLDRFENKMCKLLSDEYPEDLEKLQISERSLKAIVSNAITSAKKYGVVGGKDVELYLISMVRLGLDFDSNDELQWPKQILTRNDIDGTEKMDLFFEKLDSEGNAPEL